VIVDRYRIRQYQVRVVAAPGTLPRDIAAQIGLPGVGVRQVRDAIILEGEVENAEEMRRAVEIAGVFSTKVINQLSVRGAPSSAAAIETQIERAINLPNVRVQIIGTDTALLQGTVERSTQRQQAETVASAFAKRVVNLIELPPLTLEQVQESLGNGGAANADGTNATGTLGFNQGGVRVRQVGDQIVLEGTAPSQAELDQALTIAGRTGLQVVNRLQLARAESTLLNSVISSIGIPGVTATGNAKLLVLHGVVPDTNAAIRAEQVALSYATEVQNLLQTPNPLLVNVDVSVVEINRGNFRNLGITFPGLTETTGGFGAGLPIGGIGIGGRVPGTNLGARFDATLRALVDNNKARILSNPRTTVLSGRTAGFLVGGQIPVPEGSTTNENGNNADTRLQGFRYSGERGSRGESGWRNHDANLDRCVADRLDNRFQLPRQLDSDSRLHQAHNRDGSQHDIGRNNRLERLDQQQHNRGRAACSRLEPHSRF
jgi:Flp pilus assembly secretin CpaC